MVDYEQIGRRISEERKYLHKISQARMAEDLGMYQADISNLEKAKSGSGITDLSKLDLIADYLEIPLQSLIFGGGHDSMPVYTGSKMQLNHCTRKMSKVHEHALEKLTGATMDQVNPAMFECGPYTIYGGIETQTAFGSGSSIDENGKILNPKGEISILHLYVFFGAEVISVMTVALTVVMQHVYQPALQMLQEMIPRDILDVTDVWRTINPYWALYTFSETEEEQQTYRKPMYERMDALRHAGQNRPVLYIESAYVREDCRQKGIFRMCIDLLKLCYKGCIIWLNMEPTAGAELENEYTCLPSYNVSELGQLNINAAIAERLGFTVDPDTWHRQAETLDEDGHLKTEVILIRKCAYYLPKEIREILKDDKDLVALGRAKQRIAQQNAEPACLMDFNNGKVGHYRVAEIKETTTAGPDIGSVLCFFAACDCEDGDKYRFVVSKRSAFVSGVDQEDVIEGYDYLDDAENSEYYNDLLTVYMMLLSFMQDSENIENEL